MGFIDEPLLILDGACGSTIQEMALPAEAWGERAGCNEYLNLTAAEAIVAMHESFLDAGAMVVETNTFGANEIVLAEYDLADQTEAICIAAVANARKAVAGRAGTYVAGSVIAHRAAAASSAARSASPTASKDRAMWASTSIHQASGSFRCGCGRSG